MLTCKFSPTPGRSMSSSIPAFPRTSGFPIPAERIRAQARSTKTSRYPIVRAHEVYRRHLFVDRLPVSDATQYANDPCLPAERVISFRAHTVPVIPVLFTAITFALDARALSAKSKLIFVACRTIHERCLSAAEVLLNQLDSLGCRGTQ